MKNIIYAHLQNIATLSLFFLLPFSALSSPMPLECGNVTSDTCEVISNMGNGINLGDMFEAPYEGAWKQWFDEKYIDEISSNFSTVRIPVRWSNYSSSDRKAQIDKKFLTRIESIVQAFLEKGMTVIINLHAYNQIYGKEVERGETEVATEDIIPRYLSIWSQLALHFKNHPKKLIFEPLNEPQNQLTANKWNQLIDAVTPVIRHHDKHRILAYGPASWNSAKMLDKLKLPNDPNIVSTIHIYEPFNFTHQGITYLPMKLPKGVSCCNAIQTFNISKVISSAKEWSLKHKRPIFIGEFGVHISAKQEHRVEYIKKSVDIFRKNNLNWVFWNFSGSFGAYNSKSSRWNEDILRALTES